MISDIVDRWWNGRLSSQMFYNRMELDLARFDLKFSRLYVSGRHGTAWL